MPPIEFRLPTLLPLPNRLMRMHWRARRRLCTDLAWQIRYLIQGALPLEPIGRSTITMTRHAIQAPDVDALAASAKLALDVMQPKSSRHPYGVGIIAGDDPDHCELVARFVRVSKRTDQGVCFVVEAA